MRSSGRSETQRFPLIGFKNIFLIVFLFLFCVPAFSYQKHLVGVSLLVKDKDYVVRSGYAKHRFILAITTPVKINGNLENSLISIGSSVVVNGLVKKNIISIKSVVRVSNKGVIRGSVVSFGGQVFLAKGSLAKCLRFDVLLNKLKFSPTLRIFAVYISFVLLGLFFNFYFLKNFIFIGEYLKVRFMPSLLLGLLVLPLAMILALLFTGTVIGILFLPALLFVYIFYFFFSFYAIATLVGEWFVKLFTFRDHPYFEQFLGITLFFFVALVPLLGVPLFSLFLLTGLGAVLKLKFGVR